jgi:hypothetical protein
VRATNRARLAAIQLKGQDTRGQLGQEEIRRVMLDVIARDPSLASERLQLIAEGRGGDQRVREIDRHLKRDVRETINRSGRKHLLHFVGGAYASSKS